jgi:hypothetical protein
MMLIFFLSCGDKNADTSTSTDDTQSSVDSCPSSWEQDGELWIDPVKCIIWSPMFNDITWYEAVSSEEAVSGGCNQICDNDPEINYCGDLELQGITNWRVPSIEELEDIVMRTPPFVTEGYIWSNSSDTMDEMAWSVDLSDAGMSIAAMKSNSQNLRCIAD